MSVNNIYQQYTVLFVDDELQAQKYFLKIFGKTFKVLVASDGVEALEIFKGKADEIGLVVSDQRMPNMTGSEFLGEITKIRPDVVKILSTAFADLDAAIDAVNEGGIYRYITKPWDISELEITLRRAMEYYNLKVQVNTLAEAKLGGVERVFLQSRLLAAVAVPSLTQGKPAFVSAFKDILRLSIKDEGSEPFLTKLSQTLLNSNQREEMNADFRLGVEKILEYTKLMEGKSAPEMLQLVGSFEKVASFSDALMSLLSGNAVDSQAELLALVFALYDKGYKIKNQKQGFSFEENSDAQNSVEMELCGLFIDDSLLLSDFIQEMI